MISYNFEYYKPTSIEKTIDLYQSLKKKEKKPIFFAGGTEIITLGRVNKIITGAVIDIKEIRDCLVYKKENKQLVLGAALSLTKIRNGKSFPLLEKTVSEIADNTARNKITLGGNICANIIYREAVLPFLLADSQVVIATPNGLTEKPINELFDQRLKLKDGEMLIQVKTDIEKIQQPYYFIKKRRQWNVGYPLLTTAALKLDGKINIAFSGLCSFPFRDKKMEECLNNNDLSVTERINEAVEHIPGKVLNDVHGSDAYRIFVLKNTLMDVIQSLRKDR